MNKGEASTKDVTPFILNLRGLIFITADHLILRFSLAFLHLRHHFLETLYRRAEPIGHAVHVVEK